MRCTRSHRLAWSSIEDDVAVVPPSYTSMIDPSRSMSHAPARFGVACSTEIFGGSWCAVRVEIAANPCCFISIVRRAQRAA